MHVVKKNHVNDI